MVAISAAQQTLSKHGIECMALKSIASSSTATTVLLVKEYVVII